MSSRPVADLVPPLAVTADPDLDRALRRMAAAVGCDLTVVPDAVSAGELWAAAPLVLVGGDRAGDCLRAALPRRTGVLLLTVDDDGGVWRDAVALGAEQVHALPDDEPRTSARLAEAAEGLAGSAPVVGVLGGCGGAGASALACALALAVARRSGAPLLVDGDPLGGGLDLALGMEDAPGARWPDLSGVHGRLSGAALRDALPSSSRVSVLSAVRATATRESPGAVAPPDALAAVVAAGRRAYDLVLLDLPRATGEPARQVLALAGLVLVVVPAQVRAVAAAAAVVAWAGACGAELDLVVRVPRSGGLREAEVGRLLGLPVAGRLVEDPAVATALSRGEPPGGHPRSPLARLADRLVADLVPGLEGLGPRRAAR